MHNLLLATTIFHHCPPDVGGAPNRVTRGKSVTKIIHMYDSCTRLSGADMGADNGASIGADIGTDNGADIGADIGGACSRVTRGESVSPIRENMFDNV